MEDDAYGRKLSSDGGDEDFLLSGASRRGLALGRGKGTKHVAWLFVLGVATVTSLCLSTVVFVQSRVLAGGNRAEVVLGEEAIWAHGMKEASALTDRICRLIELYPSALRHVFLRPKQSVPIYRPRGR